jgi:hypothetical protein
VLAEKLFPRAEQVDSSPSTQKVSPGEHTCGWQVDAGPQKASSLQSTSLRHSTHTPIALSQTASFCRQSLSLAQVSRHEFSTHAWSTPQSLSPTHSTQ